jgi:hypothetical protein
MAARSSRVKLAPAAQAATSAGSEAISADQSNRVMLADWPLRIGSMPITCWHELERKAAGRSGLASFCVETITAAAPLSSRMWRWSRSVLVT